MTEKSLTFNAWSVRRILEGVQTRTLRLMKPQPFFGKEDSWLWKNYYGIGLSGLLKLAPYQVGDICWIREPLVKGLKYCSGCAIYEADNSIVKTIFALSWKWQRNKLPAMFMPRAYARPERLKITGIGIQRPQNLELEDIYAEGINVKPSYYRPEAWKKSWISIYGLKSWEANPWCWTIYFEVVK